MPEPEPGLVIRYDYLWADEAAAGRDQGKDRPACLVAASDSPIRPRFVVILPITHSPPTGATARCRDGSYSYSQHHAGSCSHHGGVAVWLDGTSTSGSSPPAGATVAACGIERWAVKTLQDRPSLLPAQATTLHFLVTRPALLDPTTPGCRSSGTSRSSPPP